MNERFKYRAKRVSNNEFVYGYLCFIYIGDEEKCRIYSPDTALSYDCYTKTLGQCVCLKDKNGSFIYEGDVVEYKIPGIPKISAIVRWSPTSVHFWKGSQDIATYQKSTVVIGNIHDNPELISKSDLYKY